MANNNANAFGEAVHKKWKARLTTRVWVFKAAGYECDALCESSGAVELAAAEKPLCCASELLSATSRRRARLLEAGLDERAGDGAGGCCAAAMRGEAEAAAPPDAEGTGGASGSMLAPYTRTTFLLRPLSTCELERNASRNSSFHCEMSTLSCAQSVEEHMSSYCRIMRPLRIRLESTVYMYSTRRCNKVLTVEESTMRCSLFSVTTMQRSIRLCFSNSALISFMSSIETSCAITSI